MAHCRGVLADRERGTTNNLRASLEAALAFVPSMPEANYDLGLLLVAEGDEAGAAELFRRAATNAPGRPEPLTELEKLGPFETRWQSAQSLVTTDKARALTQARVAAALDPEHLDAARLVARLLEELDQDEEAIKAWQRVQQMAPGDEEAGKALDRLGAES